MRCSHINENDISTVEIVIYDIATDKIICSAMTVVLENQPVKAFSPYLVTISKHCRKADCSNHRAAVLPSLPAGFVNKDAMLLNGYAFTAVTVKLDNLRCFCDYLWRIVLRIDCECKWCPGEKFTRPAG
ncbi:MAG: hypothetical protein AB1Z51_07320 [Desulfuromonadales bacterium]